MRRLWMDVFLSFLIFMMGLLFFLRDEGSLHYLKIYRMSSKSSSIGWKEPFAKKLPFWVNVNMQDSLGYSFLFYAVQKTDTLNLHYFLSRGGNPNIRNIFYQTPLHLAAMYGQIHTIIWMHQFGANINAQDRYSKTPIFYATERGSFECIRTLVDLGADLLHRDKGGDNVFDKALRRNYRNIVLFFVSHALDILRHQTAETVTYLEHWQRKYAPLFQIHSLFDFGVTYYLCARMGVFFFLLQESRDSHLNLDQ